MTIWRHRLKLLGAALFPAGLGLWPAFPAPAQTVTFDFDSATPALTAGQGIPFDQTAGGVTARFSSPSGPAFSIQTDSGTGWRMSKFSGNYLYANNQNKNALDIIFSQPVTGITLTFATADFQQVEVPTTVQLSAYVDSTQAAPVGAATAHGTYANDTMPMGTLSFSSSGQPFNLVEISIPYQPRGASAFFVDNVTVTLAASGVFASVPAASYANGSPLAAGLIASGFGAGLAAGTESAASSPLPTTLANTTLKVKDSAGVERQAPLFYVGPSQINYLVPDGTALGTAQVTVASSAGKVMAVGSVIIDRVAPGLFTANFDGKGAAAAVAITVAADQTQTTQAVARCGTAQGSCVTSPIDLGPAGTQVVLTLYGTGIRGRSALAGVTAKIGGLDSEVQYAGAQPQFAGLDQVNVVIPRALAGQGEVDLALTVDGKAANTVTVNIK